MEGQFNKIRYTRVDQDIGGEYVRFLAVLMEASSCFSFAASSSPDVRRSRAQDRNLDAYCSNLSRLQGAREYVKRVRFGSPTYKGCLYLKFCQQRPKVALVYQMKPFLYPRSANFIIKILRWLESRDITQSAAIPGRQLA